MSSDEGDEAFKKLFDSLKNRYQNNLESMRGSEFVFDYVKLLYYKCHKISFNWGRSYIAPPYWIENKKATINPIIKKDNKCVQYAVTVALNYEKIKKDPQRITKIKSFINRYNWEGINYPSGKDDQKKLEKNNVTIAIIISYAKKEKIYPTYVSKYNSNRKKQIILFMISNGLHYLAVKKLSALLRGITSKNNSDFYCLNCLHSFRTKDKLQSHKKVCENKDFCNIIMSSDDTKILEFNQCQKSDKAPFIIYADLECIIEKIDGFKNNPQSSSATKVYEHIPSGLSMSTISSFRSIENKHDVYRCKDCMKKFCGFLRDNLMKRINYEKKKMMLLTKEQQESYENLKICYICKEKFGNKYLKVKR